MKILLINPIQSPTRKPYLGIGLAYISAALKLEGAEVECLDINQHRPVLDEAQIEAEIAEREFDIAGIGCMISAYEHAKSLSRMVKRHHPDCELWMGGSIITPIPHKMMGLIPEVDVGVISEGEDTARELYRARQRGSAYDDVTGIVFRRHGELHQTPPRLRPPNLDDMPKPDWALYDLMGENGYMSYHGMAMWLLTHRGCPFDCTFCYHERDHRAHSVNRIIEEIQDGVERYGARRFMMADDLFCVDRRWVHDFCRKLIDLDLGIEFRTTGRANIIDRETASLLKQAGCSGLAMGFKTASPRMLKNIQKNQTPQHMADAVQACREVGLKPELSFMIGNQGEDMDTIAETVAFMKRELITGPMFFATPYPGTPLYEMARAQGLIPDEEALFRAYGEQCVDIVINITEFADDELQWLRDTAQRTIRRHYDKEHYKRVAHECLLPHARRLAIIASGYEGRNMVVAYRTLFEKLVLFTENGNGNGTPPAYREIPIVPLDRLATAEFDAVIVADREMSPATKAKLTQQGVLDQVVCPYDEQYHLLKSF